MIVVTSFFLYLHHVPSNKIVWALTFLFIGFVVLFFLYIKAVKAKCKVQLALQHEKKSLAEALVKVNEADLMKSVFMANISHEIRTPLNAIVGFSSLLSERELPQEEKKQYLKIITMNNDLLLKLVNDILDLARFEAGCISFHTTPCNLTLLMNKLYNSYLPDISEDISFRIKCPETSITLTTDESRLYQALANILDNAIKFTSKGFIEIGYEHSPEKQEICLYVQDSGLGISPEDQEIIFERFRKLDDFVQGGGLGLCICQAITERLGGRISILSEKGEGCRFSLLFNL